MYLDGGDLEGERLRRSRPSDGSLEAEGQARSASRMHVPKSMPGGATAWLDR